VIRERFFDEASKYGAAFEFGRHAFGVVPERN
jgi:hypothetical protein